jgi:hypothetical protein
MFNAIPRAQLAFICVMTGRILSDLWQVMLIGRAKWKLLKSCPLLGSKVGNQMLIASRRNFRVCTTSKD